MGYGTGGAAAAAGRVRLTPREAEILGHWLAVPQCIAEGLEERHPRGAVEDAAERLSAAVDARELDPAALGGIERDVLADCFASSTWLALLRDDAYDAAEMHRYAAGVAAVNRLRRKLAAAGLDVPAMPAC